MAGKRINDPFLPRDYGARSDTSIPRPTGSTSRPSYFRALLIFLIIAVALIWGADYFLLTRPLPQTKGTIVLAGLQKPVEVFRDQWGVPHIYAENTHDLLFAQGFVHAQDRLWQMEMNRRLGMGRLSEVFGSLTLEADRIIRVLGIKRAAQAELKTCSAQTLDALKAYSEGVNAFIATNRSRLPFEFRLLFITPEPWEPLHTVVWSKVMALMGGVNWQYELVRSMLAAKVGEKRARQLDPGYPKDHPVIVGPRSPMMSEASSPHRIEAFFPRLFSSLFSLGAASNSWAVTGARSATGRPILANDMHLQLSVPGIWYEIHLSGGGYDVEGLSFPGTPLIVVGHNRRIAWGITFAYVDVMDLYEEIEHPAGGKKYLFDGKPEKAKVIRERINVRGWEDPYIENVIITRHGPIVSGITKGADGPLALKWSMYDPGDLFQAINDMCKAEDWSRFRAAAALWSEPAVNLTYADADGNIGYVLGARIPIRESGNGLMPVPGSRSGFEWKGYVPAMENPSVFNPVSGIVFTANNRIAGKDYPYFISEDWDTGYRAASIGKFLASREKISLEDCRALQGDTNQPAFQEIRPILQKLEGKNGLEKRAIELMLSWNGDLTKETSGGALFQVFQYTMLKNTFDDELGDAAPYYFGAGLNVLNSATGYMGRSQMVLRSLMKDPDSPWFDDVNTAGRERLPDIMQKSLADAVEFLNGKQGDNPDLWKWGDLHRAPLEHRLGKIRPLDMLLNIGRFPVGGGIVTVRQGSYVAERGFEINGWTAANRHIFSLDDFDRSLSNIVAGQSGQVRSPHYADQVDLWLNVEHHPLYFSRKTVEKNAKFRLVLEPGL